MCKSCEKQKNSADYKKNKRKRLAKATEWKYLNRAKFLAYQKQYNLMRKSKQKPENPEKTLDNPPQI